MAFREVRTRFAPSPTGYMHIGNLRTALYEFLIAKSQNGKFILRIEDTDQERFVEGAVDVIYKTLEMTGITYDEGPDKDGGYGPYIQSQRRDLYIKYARQLVDMGKAYYCFCSKERLDKIKAESDQVVAGYDRHCRNLPAEEVQKNLEAGIPYVIRQKMPVEGKTVFKDLVYGEVEVDNSTLEDQILIKSDGLPTYNFANVIDDHLMDITHVVRGNEYLSSTPKYNLLYEAFGWDIPTYIHLPPVMKDSKNKLSKRTGDASFQDLVDRGFLPEAILNYIALLGWSPSSNQEIFTLDELIKEFDISGLSKSPAIFDIAKLSWMNGEYIRAMEESKFYDMALPYLKNTIKQDDFDYRRLAQLVQKRVDTFNDIPGIVEFLVELPEYDMELYTHKKMKTNTVNSYENLKVTYEAINNIPDSEWGEENLYNRFVEIAEKLQVKNSQVLWPIRTALSGKDATPGGASELAYLLGKDETLRRIAVGIEKLKAYNEQNNLV